MPFLPFETTAEPITLRPYQVEALERVTAGFAEYRRQLLVAPTGAGKTIMFAALAHQMQPGKTLILAHREELIEQAVDKIYTATGLHAEIEKAEQRAMMDAPVVVASVQTLMRDKRLNRWPADHFNLVVADEAHHAISDSWQKVLGYFDEGGANILGVTATPDRGDKKNLGKYFENIAHEINLFDLIKQGYLARISIRSLPIRVDLTKVRQVAGDYSAEEVSDAIAPYFTEIARAIRDAASFRKVLVFLPLVATSQAFAQICQNEGLRAAHIDGMSKDRADILAAFKRDEFDVLCNAMLLTEGFDEPSIDCVVILRPTRSRALYSQMVGRGTRICEAKENLLLLDFLWLHEKHNLIRPAHLVAKTEDIAEQMTEYAEEAGKSSKWGPEGEIDLQDLETDAKAQRERKLQEELKKQAKRKARSMDAMQFCLSVHNMELAEYEPEMTWESKPVTDGQAKALMRFGIDPGTISCRGHASKILDVIFQRQKLKLATPKQIKYLQQMGHESPETATFNEASEFLNQRWGKRPQA